MPVNPIHVLLVEDDPDQVAVIQALSRKCSIPTKIHVASNGLEAMEFLWGTEEAQTSTRPSVVLLDLNMPELDGRTLLSEIRSHPGLSRLPVVILTASEENDDVVRGMQMQARGFLRKPVTWQDLDAVFRQVVQGAKGWG